MLELTAEQHQALQQMPQGLLRVRDPHTGAVYVLVREDDYERMQQVAGSLTQSWQWKKPAQEGYEPERDRSDISETLSQVFRDQGAWLLDFADRSPSVAAPLSFQGRLNIDDVAHIQRYRDLLQYSRPVRWVYAGLAVALSWVCIWALPLFGPIVFLLGILVVFFFYMALILPRERVWSARRFYRQHQESYLESRVILTPERVYIENAMHRHDFIWGLLALICDTPEGLMFCAAGNQVYFWLPQRLFEGNELRRQVLQLAEINKVRVQRLS
jgi:hypothetical protein